MPLAISDIASIMLRDAGKIEISDLKGRTLHTVSASEGSYLWDASGVPHGICLIRADFGSSVSARRLMVVR